MKISEWFLPYTLDLEQYKELQNIINKRKMVIGGIPAFKPKATKPFLKAECVLCGSFKESHAVPQLDFCLRCFRNYVQVRDYAGHHSVCTYGFCNRCGSLFNAGVSSYELRVCTDCLLKNRIKGRDHFNPVF